MQHRFRPAARACVGAVVLAFLCACAGGGGGSTPSTPATAAPVTSTPAPGSLNVPGQQSSGGGAGGFKNDGQTLSTYAVSSNPSGQTFSLDGLSSITPKTVTPPVSTGNQSIAFASGFSVPIVQLKDGAHTVFYNAASDSKGTIAVSSLQAVHRQTASVSARRLARLPHRTFRRKNASSAHDIDPTRLAVRMSSSALRASGRLPADVERAAGSFGQSALSATADQLRVVSVPAGVDAAAFTRKLQAQPEVAEVTPIHIRHLLARAPTSVSDPLFSLPFQWYTFASGTNYAWSYNPGTGAKIAVIDTGIDKNNPDLSSQLVYQETDLTPLDPTTCIPVSGATTVVTPSITKDDNGHGTDVAGIALAAANNADLFAGAGWGAKLMAFRIFPDQTAACNEAANTSGANSVDEAKAIDDAVAQGADVINLSLGSGDSDTVEFNAIQSAIAAGVTVVAAAGNGPPDAGLENGMLDYPGAYPGVISVGASALKDQYYSDQFPQADGTYASSTEIVASYSSYGPSLSVVAPGGDAVNEDPNACAATPGGSHCDLDFLHWIENYTTSTPYGTTFTCSFTDTSNPCANLFNGTSMATPQVAATAAMLIAEAGGHKSLTPAQIKYTIESTADNIGDARQGHGRLNAYRALASLIRDTAAYSGPIKQVAGTTQLVAFAYNTSRTNKPTILDATFPAGVPVATDGSFRIADVPVAVGGFRVAVWYDANGDGVIDAGDQIGVSAATCSSSSVCPIGSIALHAVAAGYFLP
jgi:subtilisin family serine protease